ncbi:MAG: MFS transporter [Candidatus Latescibacteria bacterium]|nr:MFS transporter [Candidatus Latescibacterota bacterium]
MSDDKNSSRLVAASPVYYGWVILAVGTFGVIMTSPGQTYAFSAFLDHFIADLGLSRSFVSTLYTAATLTASFALPYVGRQFDQRGARVMIALTSLLLGLACIYMSFVRNAVMLCIGFFLLRQLGQGSLTLMSENVINLWWVRRRGLVMGIGGVASALLSGLFPYLINTLIPLYGWRLTYVALGASLILVMLPVGWIFVRDRPENHGLQPDGIDLDSDKAAESAAPLEVNWTRAQALRTASFWVTVAGLASMSMLNTGLTFHLFSVFEDSGLSSAVAASVFVPIAATGAVVQLVGGLLIGRVPIRGLLALSLLMQALVLVIAPRLASLEMAYFFGFCMGVQVGLEMIVSSVVFANFYGRRHLGSIAGLAATILVGASALGPMPIGVARDLLGNYAAVLNTFAVLPFVLAIACLLFCKAPGAPPEEA